MKHLMVLLCFWIPLALFAEPELLWKRAVAGKVSAWQAEGPDGTLYLLSEDRGLHALDSATGTDLWRYRPGGELVDFLAVGSDGMIFVQNNRGEIDAVNPEGQALWRCALSGRSTLLPLVTPEGTLVLLMEKGELAAISRQGTLLWTTDIPGKPSSSPVMDLQGVLYVPLKTGGIALFDRDGRYLQTLVSSELAEIILDKEGTLYGVTAMGQVYAWSEKTLLWNTGTEPGLYSSLLMKEDELYMILQDGLIYRINQSGAEGYYQGPPPVHHSMITDSGTILTVDKNHVLWEIDLEQQTQTGYTLPTQPTLPLLTSRGYLIFGGVDWKLYAYSMERPMEGWAQYRGNAARNGTLFSVLSPETRVKIYQDHPVYRRFRYMIETEESENQEYVLDQIDAVQSWEELNEKMPFWDITLLEIAGNGVNRMILRDGAVVKTNPLVRADAYRLLSKWDVHYLRTYIISTLKAEKDPLVLSEGYLSLGRLGADWDGQSVNTIDRTLFRTPHPTDRQILSAGQAYMMLLEWGGKEQSARVLNAFYQLFSLPLSSELTTRLNNLLEEKLN